MADSNAQDDHHRPVESETSAAGPPTRRSRWQLSMATLLLLTAVVAVWVSYFVLRSQTAQLRSQLQTMRQVAGEVVVTAPGRFAVISRPQLWQDEDRWQVYLPPDHAYRLRLATRQIGGSALPPPRESFTLQPGIHNLRIAVEEVEDGWQLQVDVDGEQAMRVLEETAWKTDSASGMAERKTMEEQPLDQPLVLKRWRFHERVGGGQMRRPDEPGNGFQLWIETADE